MAFLEQKWEDNPYGDSTLASVLRAVGGGDADGGATSMVHPLAYSPVVMGNTLRNMLRYGVSSAFRKGSNTPVLEDSLRNIMGQIARDVETGPRISRPRYIAGYYKDKPFGAEAANSIETIVHPGSRQRKLIDYFENTSAGKDLAAGKPVQEVLPRSGINYSPQGSPFMYINPSEASFTGYRGVPYKAGEDLSKQWYELLQLLRR